MIYNLNFFNLDFHFQINRRSNKKQFIVFNYHQIGKNYIPKYHLKDTFTQSDFFEKQIKWIKKTYNVISLSKAIKMANENCLDGNYACITFDDGDKSILEAMNILKKYDLPATFFINSSYLNNNDTCWFNIYQYLNNSNEYRHLLTDELHIAGKSLRNTRDKEYYRKYSDKFKELFTVIKNDFDLYVKFEDLLQIDSNLFDIGSHGFEHEKFSMMSKDWQANNIQKDINLLKELKSFKPIFAIPFGRQFDWNMDTINVLTDLKLDFVFADGGINTKREIGYRRIPSDNRILKNIPDLY